MKVIVWFLATAALVLGGIYVFSLVQELSYFALSNNFVETETLIENPIQFSGRIVCTAGKYEIKGNVGTLTSLTGLKNKKIWINAPVEISLWSSFKQKYFSEETFSGTAKVCGSFSYTSDSSHGFGPTENFQYQISK